MLILTADDAKFMRVNLGNILKKLGHEIVEAENGQEAVKEIKKIDPKAKIVMVSAMGQKEMVLEAIQSGAMDFVVKPFQEDRIREVLDKVN